jgi:hypothetical protein
VGEERPGVSLLVHRENRRRNIAEQGPQRGLPIGFIFLIAHSMVWHCNSASISVIRGMQDPSSDKSSTLVAKIRRPTRCSAQEDTPEAPSPMPLGGWSAFSVPFFVRQRHMISMSLAAAARGRRNIPRAQK